MPDPEDGPPDLAERHLQKSSKVKEAWAQTIEDMEAVAEGRREDGWEVVSIPAVHTDVIGRDAGSEGFGLKNVIADNHAEEFSAIFDESDFDDCLVYGTDLGSDIYRVCEYLDTERRTGILLASHYEIEFAQGMVTAAKDEGVVYSHAKTIDGTHLGTFRHDDYEPVLPAQFRSDEDGQADADRENDEE